MNGWIVQRCVNGVEAVLRTGDALLLFRSKKVAEE